MATGRTVLVVEDDPHVRAVFSRLLSGAGYDVATAENGQEALRRMRADPKPCLVILDLLLPVLDGWSLCEAIRAEPATAALPIIVCSGTPPQVQESGSVALNVQEFQPKPVNSAALLAAVARYCDWPPT